MWGLIQSAFVYANALAPAWSGISGVVPQRHYGGQKHHKAPHAPYADGGAWADAFELAKDAVLNMTVEEKVGPGGSGSDHRSTSPLPYSVPARPTPAASLD